MFRINIIKRLPKKPLLALAVLALALVATGGVARNADAQTAASTFEVTFNSITFSRLDDCPSGDTRCDTADLYGYMTAVANSGSSGGVQMGRYGQGCIRAWEYAYDGHCTRHVVQGNTKLFRGAALCTMQNAFDGCLRDGRAPYKQDNNKVVVTARAGETITVQVNLSDYDYFADDQVCVKSRAITLTQWDTIKGSTKDFSLSQVWNGYGSCTVSFTLRTL